MKLIKVKINPKSSFITLPKGDTIFGHFAYHLFLQGKNILKNYLSEEPKVIFSDILPEGYIYKPSLPIDNFGVDENQKKDFRKKNWIKLEALKDGIKVQNQNNFYPYEDLKFTKTEIRVRNTINRKTFTTDESGVFAPYALEEFSFLHQPVLYILYKDIEEDLILETLNTIGKNGFGKKGSIGKGYFEVVKDSNFNGFNKIDSNYYITLSPTILQENDNIDNAYYDIFNRFGKQHYSKTPYKKPVTMADSGAVVKLNRKSLYIGNAANNAIGDDISFLQGYSIVVPFKCKGL